MMKPTCFLIFLIFFNCGAPQKTLHNGDAAVQSYSEAKQAIQSVLTNQTNAWNNHDLEEYMQGYWKSDSLKFFGSRGLTFGWDKTLENYKKSYPTKNESGTLKFIISDISKIENNSYSVMGEYHLTRKIGDAHGVFTLIFKYVDGQWKILSDMSC